MRTGRIEAWLWLVLAGCGAGGTPDEAGALRELEKGIRAANAGDHDAAIRHFTRVITLAPHASRGFDLRAKSHAKLGNDKEALADYGQAISVAPDVDKALHLSNRARYHQSRGRTGAAERDFNSAVARQKEWPHPMHLTDIYFNRAAFFLDTDRPDRCIADCEHVLSLNPDADTRGNFERLRDEALAKKHGSGK